MGHSARGQLGASSIRAWLPSSAQWVGRRRYPSLFEPVQGSAPDIAGRLVANPVAMIWSAALMLDFLGVRAAHDAIVAAIDRVLRDGPRAADLGGKADASTMGRAIEVALG